MAKKSKLSPIATAVGVSVVASLAGLGVANAASNPFTTSDLGTGYKVAAQGNCGEGKKAKEGKCGEGKCGEGKKAKEGKCGEGKCGEGKKKDKEGKCGEGKCGGSK